MIERSGAYFKDTIRIFFAVFFVFFAVINAQAKETSMPSKKASETKSAGQLRMPSSQEYSRMTLPDQFAALDDFIKQWNALPIKDDLSRAQVLSLIGEMTTQERIFSYSEPQLKAMISALVALAEGDQFSETGMVALELQNLLGFKRVHKHIRDLDKSVYLRASIKRVTQEKR